MQALKPDKAKLARKPSFRKPKKKDKKSEENQKNEAKQEVDPQEAFRSFAYEKIKNAFAITNANEDITITVDNVFPLMKALELDAKDENVLDMVRTACIETFGDMDPVEFDKAVVEQRRQKSEEVDPIEGFEDEIRSAFSLIDADQDGMITLQDVYQLMMGLGEMLTDEELGEMIQGADTNKDGQISYKEFKRFILDLPEEDDDDEEEQPIEADEEDKDEQDPDASEKETTDKDQEGKKEDGSAPEGDSAQDGEGTPEEKQENEEPKTDETNTEEPKEPEKPKPKRRSVLWGYTSEEKIKVEETKTKEVVVEETISESEESKGDGTPSEDILKVEEQNSSDKKDDVSVKQTDASNKDESTADDDESTKHDKATTDDESEKKEESTKQEESSETDVLTEKETSSQGVISVTVKQLDSIKEEGQPINQVKHTRSPSYSPGRRVFRPRSSKSANVESRPISAITISESIKEESGTSAIDSEHEGDITEGSRVTSARSRKSSARSRLSSAKSKGTGGVAQTESTSLDFEEELLDDSDDDDDGSSEITDPNVFHSPPSARQLSRMENMEEIQSYCEISDPNSQIEDWRDSFYSSRCNSPRLSYKTLEDYLPSNEENFTGLKRIKSSNTLRRINDIQQTLLKRQMTAPQLDMDAIRRANSAVKENNTKPNINGICTHLRIDLNIPLMGKKKLTNYDSYMQRPKTALSFNEARRKSLFRASSFTAGRLVNHPDSSVNVIDLSKTLASKDNGHPEHPALSLFHHGYKSVGPLARVLSARKQSKQNGKNYEFHSVSRQLEKGFVVTTEGPRKHFPFSAPNSPNSKQTVINLDLKVPVKSNNTKCKKFSNLSRLPPDLQAWGRW